MTSIDLTAAFNASQDGTEGPWVVQDLGGHPKYPDLHTYNVLAPQGWRNPDGSYVVCAIATGLDSEPIARLIAAAPAMRDALNLLIAMDNGNYEQDTVSYERAYAQARVAIHLATKGATSSDSAS